MKEIQQCKLHEPMPKFETCSDVVACVAGRSSGRLVSFAITLFVSAFPVMFAQTGASHIAEIHNHLRKAGEYLKANNPNSAAKEFNAVLAIDPKNAEAYANLGVIAYFQRDYQHAAGFLRKALTIDPSLEKSWALLGICRQRLGDPSAQAQLERSFSKLTDRNLRTQVGMTLISLYRQHGDAERAAPVLQTLVRLNPENTDILYMAQQFYRELADDTLNKLAVIAPGSAQMQQVIAQRLVNAGDLKGAIEHYRKALEIEPQLPGAHYELAEAVFESARTDGTAQTEAEHELQAAIRFDGDSAGVECELAKIALSQAAVEKAQAHYTRAFALDSGNTEAQLGLGEVLMTMNKPAEAKKYFEMAVQSEPLNGAAHYRLALAYKRLAMNEQAQREMHVFEEIKTTKDRVKELYRQMNVRPQASDDMVEPEQ
jgi:tetratricopeptide (TPR) repeat protein